ncbi:hypothetical protein FB45DRAFT_1062618 [Roridomyces roridus]|uniref:F-box domain-containing protein n=1 Tax=Roridomyces roridus TaxID=1738132 RepID=A0AAD7BGQ3_9AGAR|nr:hypothetical protein FB45DRAFT_1062618 [Roridomyces roridus]
MSLAKMPPEIFCEILSLLPPKVLLTCLTVSRAWHGTILRSPALQYVIRLWKDGLVPGDPGSSSSTDMLRELDRRRQAWANLDWTSQTVVEILDTNTAESVVQRQGLGIDAENLEDFTLDPAQDLIASFHQSCPGQGTLVFQTLSGRQHHPMARCPMISFPIDRDMRVLLYTQIAGDVVGAAIFEGGYCTLRLWNWHTGDCLARLPQCDSPYPESQFLSPRALVQSVPTHNGRIEIYTIKADQIGVSSVIQVASLHLPALDDDYDLEFIEMHAGPTCPQPMPRRPFSSAYTRRIYMFHLRYITDDGSLQPRLFVPHRTLDSYVSRYDQERLTAPLDVPWEDWGPQNTRMLPGDEYSWAGHVHGERVVLPADDAGKKCMNLLDFRPIVPGQPEFAQSRAPDTRTSFVSSPTTINEPFENPVTTSLPYRSTFRHMDENFDVLLLDQDHIIGVNSKKAT